MQLPAPLFSPMHIVGFLMRLWKSVVSALSPFGRGSFRPGSFRPESIRPWVDSANFGESFRPDFLFNLYILYYILYARCVCYTRLVYHIWKHRLLHWKK